MASKKLVTTLVGGAVAVATIATAGPAMAIDSFATATYTVNGTTHIGAQVNSDLPLGPSTLKATINLDTGAVSNGTLPLPSKVLTFPIFGGAATLRATVNFIQSGTITGQLGSDAAGNGTAAATAKYTIKLTDAQFKTPITPFFAPIFVGNSCQTASPVTLNFKTPAGQNFDPSSGGTLTTKYTIGQFTGCSALFIPGVGSAIVNALVPGSNNTASVRLSNGQLVFQ